MGYTAGPTIIKRMNTLEIGWLAGILEGEGCFRIGLDERQGCMPQMRVVVSMVDWDVISRLYEITGIGRLHTAKKPLPSGKTMYTWTVSRKSDIYHMLCSIVPLLSERRRDQISTMLARYESTH